MYNLTALGDNSTTIIGFIQTTNTELMNGWFGVMILIGFSIITLIAFINATGDTSKSLASTAFISFLLALFLKMLMLIPNLALFITLVAAAGCIAFVKIGQ